jgi:hypothetical protein
MSHSRNQKIAEQRARRRAGDTLPTTHGISRLSGFNGARLPCCQWQHDDGTMCDQPTHGSSSYCADHHAKIYQKLAPPKPRPNDEWSRTAPGFGGRSSAGFQFRGRHDE